MKTIFKIIIVIIVLGLVYNIIDYVKISTKSKILQKEIDSIEIVKSCQETSSINNCYVIYDTRIQ